MKQLAMLNRLITQRQQLFLYTQRRVFSTATPPPSDEEQKREAFLQKERAHFESLSDKEKVFYKAYRFALLKKVEESWVDKNNWWNKVA